MSSGNPTSNHKSQERALLEKMKSGHGRKNGVPNTALAALVAGLPILGPEAAQAAMLDPKKAKRILANRQSAARSKERKLRYISELEGQVAVLEGETEDLLSQHNKLRNSTHKMEEEKQQLLAWLAQAEKEVAERELYIKTQLESKLSHLKANLQQDGTMMTSNTSSVPQHPDEETPVKLPEDDSGSS